MICFYNNICTYESSIYCFILMSNNKITIELKNFKACFQICHIFLQIKYWNIAWRRSLFFFHFLRAVASTENNTRKQNAFCANFRTCLRGLNKKARSAAEFQGRRRIPATLLQKHLPRAGDCTSNYYWPVSEGSGKYLLRIILGRHKLMKFRPANFINPY